MLADLIQTACLIRGRKVPVYASDSTLGKPPHRDTLLEKPIKNRERERKGIRP
jgi:hypothetical protein